jgi:protein-S-isoprenylcysteine O-methyltransferase Ste14
MNPSYFYFQMSILIVFSALVAGRIIHLRHKYKTNAVSIIRNKGVHRFLGITVITIINVWVAILLVYVLHPEIEFLPFPLDLVLVDTTPVKIIGISLICLGLVIYIAAWVSLSNAWRIGQDHELKGDLIRKGIYRISRNPMYLFYDLYFVGTFMINGALIFLIMSVLLIITLHYLIIQEEKYLNLNYGESFITYAYQTRRYLNWRKLRFIK